MNRFDANWHEWSTWQGHETIIFGGQEVKEQGHTWPKYITKIPIGEISQELSSEF